ncbi:MAG: GWxTD domain-containing protein [Saprospiraceae bacterium]|nr:GWxTD domain-containing protein [Saprospiraceae bacterium]
MKKLFLFPILFVFQLTSLQALDAGVSFCSFKSPDQNYLEIYFHFFGKTIGFDTLSTGELQAGVEVFIMFSQGEKIVKVDKYNLYSPRFVTRKDFLDLKRYALENGDYDLFIKVTDLKDINNRTQFNTKVKMSYEKDELALSDIQMLASLKKAEDANNTFVKNGFEMEPLAYSFLNKSMSALSIYHEVYNSEKYLKDLFTIEYNIFKIENEQQKGYLTKTRKLKPGQIIPVVQSFNISDLPSGNYALTIELRTSGDTVLLQKAITFQRSNPNEDDPQIETVANAENFIEKLSKEDLEYSLRAIAPLSENEAEYINGMIASGVRGAQVMYLTAYWEKLSPTNPKVAYDKYMEVARAVDKQYQSGFGHGFETDRGYIFLKYGRPDDIVRVDDEPSAPPYEIWSYNYFPKTSQGNVRFLFYNPSLSPGNFVLLHSNARGELNNPQWQLDLYRDAPNDLDGGNYIDGTEVMDNFGRRAARYFNDY